MGDIIIVWVCKGVKCHQHKESALVGGTNIFGVGTSVQKSSHAFVIKSCLCLGDHPYS
jgi:hypothetical protein